MSDEVFKIKVDDSELEEALKGFEKLKTIQKKLSDAKKKEGKEDGKDPSKGEQKRLSIFQRLIKLKKKERSEEEKHAKKQEKATKKMMKDMRTLKNLSAISFAGGMLGNIKQMAQGIRQGRFTAGGLGLTNEQLKKTNKASNQIFGDEGTLSGVMQQVTQAFNSPESLSALATLGVDTSDLGGNAIDRLEKVFKAVEDLDFSGIENDYMRQAFEEVTGMNALEYQGNREKLSNIRGEINKQEVMNNDNAILSVAESVEKIENKMIDLAGGLLDKALPAVKGIWEKLTSFFDLASGFFKKARDFFSKTAFSFVNLGMILRHGFAGLTENIKEAVTPEWLEGDMKQQHARNQKAREQEYQRAWEEWNAPDVAVNDAYINKDGTIIKLNENDNIYAFKGNNAPGNEKQGVKTIKLDLTIRDPQGVRLANSIINVGAI